MRDIRTFVRCGAQVVELSAQPLTVGRAETCELVIDDELASREHCRIELVGDRVEVVDLGSRNGVLVNGLPVDGRQEVHHGDLITAGRSQISVSRQAHRPRFESVDDAPPARARKSSSADLTETGNVFEILGGSARTSLEDGDVPSAERSARNLFVAIKSSLARGRDLRDAVVDDAVEIALRLADHTGDVGWLDRVLELHLAAKRPMSVSLTDGVIERARASGGGLKAADEYLAFARAEGDPSAERLRELGS